MGQILVIRQNDDFVWRPNKEVAVVLQTSDHRQEFSVPDVVVLLYGIESLREVGYGLASTLLVSLKEDCPYHE